jgi:three-Cys-motif partner protein
MARKDLHEQPFDEGTIAKLEVFEDYAQAWIPTFVMQGISPIFIVDFFAGPGYDKNGVAGSPLRILRKLAEQVGNIRAKRVTTVVCFNERDKEKYDLLEAACNTFLSEHTDLKGLVELRLYNEDFESLFPKLLPQIQRFPSLVYLDQNGITFLSPKYFLQLETVNRCDFLYFVSASYVWRFGNTKEFKIHLNIDLDEAKRNPYRFIHRSLLEQIMASLPSPTKLRLYPFSIRKGSNIYGIIFGAKHPLAVEKYLDIAWKRDSISGEANFDINEEALKDQLGLFEAPKLKKVEAFAKRLEEAVLSGERTNNFEVYEYATPEGHPARHAAEVLRRLKTEGKISYESSSPLVSYQAVHRDKRKLNYEVV